jgi:hypothetical protein
MDDSAAGDKPGDKPGDEPQPTDAGTPCGQRLGVGGLVEVDLDGVVRTHDVSIVPGRPGGKGFLAWSTRPDPSYARVGGLSFDLGLLGERKRVTGVEAA